MEGNINIEELQKYDIHAVGFIDECKCKTHNKISITTDNPDELRSFNAIGVSGVNKGVNYNPKTAIKHYLHEIQGDFTDGDSLKQDLTRQRAVFFFKGGCFFTNRRVGVTVVGDTFYIYNAKQQPMKLTKLSTEEVESLGYY